MNSRQLDPYRNRIRTRNFLLNKAGRVQPKDVRPNSPVNSGFIIDHGRIAAIFPHMLDEKAFLSDTLKKLDQVSRFGAMAIRRDYDDKLEKEDNDEGVINGAQVIDRVCREEEGMWGMIRSGVFGCVFPGHDEQACKKTAEKIQTRLLNDAGQTATIGIAQYPTLFYKKYQILHNALKALDHAAFFSPDHVIFFDAVSINISGDNRFQQGDINGAIEEFKAGLIFDSSDVNLTNSLGVCYGMLGAYEKAEKYFSAAFKLNADNVMPIYNMAIVNLLINNKDRAFEYLKKADALVEDVFEIAFQLGKLYLEKKEYKKAAAGLRRAVALNPDFGPAYRYLGRCLVELKKIDEAVSVYKKAVQLTPNDADALSGLGHLFDLKGENPEITTIFCRQSVEIEPENSLFRIRLGRLYLKQNQLEDALREFKKARDLGADATDDIERIEEMML